HLSAQHQPTPVALGPRMAEPADQKHQRQNEGADRPLAGSIMVPVRGPFAVLMALAAVGCGGAKASPTTTTDGDVEHLRAAAVRLVLADLNATALPRAYDANVIRKRMRRYVARRWLERRVRQTASDSPGVDGRKYFQSWTEAITVGRWE